MRRTRPQGRRSEAAHHLRHLLLQRARSAQATEEGRMKILLAALVSALCVAFAGSSAGACSDPGGIGGTGQRAEAEIGVLGVITGFGSICVNGIEVHYDSGTPVAYNGDLSSAKALGIGQVVSVLAIGASTQARAQWIDIV